MFKQFLQNLHGISGWMIASLLIFMVFFLTVCVYVFFTKNSHFRHVSRLPLE